MKFILNYQKPKKIPTFSDIYTHKSTLKLKIDNNSFQMPQLIQSKFQTQSCTTLPPSTVFNTQKLDQKDIVPSISRQQSQQCFSAFDLDLIGHMKLQKKLANLETKREEVEIQWKMVNKIPTLVETITEEDNYNLIKRRSFWRSCADLFDQE